MGHLFARQRDMFAVALHRQLLEIGWKTFQILFVGQDSHGLRAEKIIVPYGKQAH